ncbi:MAG: hypothetical protein JXP37_10220 [Coriobacteriia bacterium]|nr:hypothetical protein [Coriobacteriia bacterium]
MRKAKCGIRHSALLAILLVYAVSAGACTSDSEATIDAAGAPVAKYGVRAEGWSYWRNHGDVVSDVSEVRERVGFSPLRIEVPNGHERLGALTVGNTHDSAAPRWYVEFWDDITFHQSDEGSAEATQLVFDNRPERIMALSEPVTYDVTVRGYPGYGWNTMRDQAVGTTDGSQIYYNEDECGVRWVEGNMVYTISSPTASDYHELLDIAEKATPAAL